MENLGSYEFPQGIGQAIYGGFEGFDFGGEYARYVVITANNNWGGSCYGLAEVKFNLLFDDIEPEYPENTFDCSNVSALIIGLPSTTSSNAPITLSANPPGGTFSGLGVVFNAFNPSLSGPGLHSITYNYTDGNDCTATASQSILVFTISFTFVNYNLGTISPKIDNHSELVIDATVKDDFAIHVYDVAGRAWYNEHITVQPGKQNTGLLPFKNLSKGLYIFTISNGDKIQSEKIYVAE